jgi:hypothetical protein
MDANTTSVSDRGYQADMLWVKTINRHCVRGGGGRNVQRDGKNKRKKLVHLFPPQTEHAPRMVEHITHCHASTRRRPD